MPSRKICVDCSAPAYSGPRCPRHAAQHRDRKFVPHAIKMEVVARQGGRCAQCRALGVLQVDHIIRAERGGTAVARNLQGLCRPCHARKTRRERGVAKSYSCPRCGKAARRAGVCGKCAAQVL